MMLSRLGRAFRSIHTRMLLAMIVSGLGIHVLMLTALSVHRAIMADAFRSSVAQYVQYLVRDLGFPPEIDRAVELADRTGMTIHYFSPEGEWSTSGRPPSAPLERIRTRYSAGPVQTGVFDGNHYLIYRMDSEHRFLFEIGRDPAKDRRLAWLGPFLVLMVTLLFIGSYRWVRRIMAPLRPLTEGVRLVGSGRLDHRVSVQRLDELGELASAFNSMTERLQALIHFKDRMLLDVSHELRSPLTRMKVALVMSPDSALKESLSEDIDEMERMVTTILTNARAQSGNLTLERQRVDFASLIRDSLEPFMDQPPGVRFQNPTESFETFVDPEKVKTVLGNVTGNAIKYSKETSGPVTVRLYAGLDSLIVEIQDEGIGIPEQDLAFVFEPFYRVDRSRSRETGGVGLGLSLCKAIMEAHGGSISMESTLGKGTTVRIKFPLEDSKEKGESV
jgi:signal transduction histidine kinase